MEEIIRLVSLGWSIKFSPDSNGVVQIYMVKGLQSKKFAFTFEILKDYPDMISTYLTKIDEQA